MRLQTSDAPPAHETHHTPHTLFPGTLPLFLTHTHTLLLGTPVSAISQPAFLPAQRTLMFVACFRAARLPVCPTALTNPPEAVSCSSRPAADGRCYATTKQPRPQPQPRLPRCPGNRKPASSAAFVSPANQYQPSPRLSRRVVRGSSGRDATVRLSPQSSVLSLPVPVPVSICASELSPQHDQDQRALEPAMTLRPASLCTAEMNRA